MVLKVENSSLASVLILDRGLEEYPEPYRRQSDMTLVVSYTEYVKFIEKYLEVTDYLMTPSVYLRSKLALGDEERVCRAFYKDMACAVMKEVWYTNRGGDPTNIVHSFEDVPAFGDSYVEAFSGAFKQELARAQNALLDLFEGLGFQFNSGVIYRQQKVVDYASLLFAMSSPNNEFGVDFVKWSMMEE